jgi:hypothetical protein
MQISPPSHPRSRLSKALQSTGTARRPVGRLGLLIVLVSIIAASDAFSFDSNDSKLSLARLAEGLAFVDLPMGMRARFDVTYSDDVYRSDVLVRPFTPTTGPRIRDDESLESQFTLTHSLSEKVEIGIVWATHSPVAPVDLFDFHHQTIRAFIRIVP